MKPLYISVDTEFTDGDLSGGQLMQVAFVSNETGRAAQWVFPITSEAKINPWVWQNLRPLVTACLVKGAFEVKSVSSWRYQQAESLARWLAQDALDAFWKRADVGGAVLGEVNPVPAATDAAKIPLVMVTWCGAYDYGHLDRLWHDFNLPNPFRHEMVDIAGLALGLGFEWDTSGSALCEELGMKPNENPHDALADAQHQLEMFRLLMLRRKALGRSE